MNLTILYSVLKTQFSAVLGGGVLHNIFNDSFHAYKYWHNQSVEFNNENTISQHIFRSVEEGKIIVNSQGKTVIAKKGDLLYIPLGQFAEAKILAEPKCHGTVLRLHYLPKVDLLGYPLQAIKMSDELKDAFNEIPILTRFERNITVNVIWKTYKFLDIFQNTVTPYTDKYNIRLQKALEFMKENDDYSIKELAKYCEISERQLRDTFYKVLNVSPIEMKHRIQAVKADTLLKTTDLSVEEIANKVGYYSTNQLRNVMKKRYFALPKEIRKKSK